jgi:hypothetical protein
MAGGFTVIVGADGTRCVDQAGWAIARRRASRQAPVGCVLADRPPPLYHHSYPSHIQGAVEQAEVAHAPADQVHVAGSVATMFYAARPLV